MSEDKRILVMKALALVLEDYGFTTIVRCDRIAVSKGANKAVSIYLKEFHGGGWTCAAVNEGKVPFAHPKSLEFMVEVLTFCLGDHCGGCPVLVGSLEAWLEKKNGTS